MSSSLNFLFFQMFLHFAFSFFCLVKLRLLFRCFTSLFLSGLGFRIHGLFWKSASPFNLLLLLLFLIIIIIVVLFLSVIAALSLLVVIRIPFFVVFFVIYIAPGLLFFTGWFFFGKPDACR